MNPKQLKEILGFGENQQIEFKANTRAIDAIGATACAFLNVSGGVIVCGVEDDSNPVGVENAQLKAERLEAALLKAISPSALISVEIFPLDGVDLVLVDVPAGKDTPFAFNDNIYVRTGAHTRKADVQTIRDMVLSKSVEAERWERRISTNISEADLDYSELKQRADEIKKKHPVKLNDGLSEEELLSNLSLSRYGQLTNAGDLFFSKNPAVRLPQVRVRATCFADETSDAFRDNRIIEGPLVQVFNETLNFILRNVRSRSVFHGQKIKREDDYLYPVPAIREGLINAFAHRDYADYSGGITVNIYPSRLEIRNSGGFPEGITPENISAGHFIVLRNPDVANILHLLGLMDRIGRGGRLIVRECIQHGLPDPIWKSDLSLGVTLTLSSGGGVDLTLSRHQVDILRKCINPIGIADMMVVVGRSDRTKFRHQVLAPLMERGFVEMTVPEKPRSSKQKYKLTALGLNVLEEMGRQ